MDEEFDLRECARIVWQRRYVIAATTLVGIAVAAFVSIFVVHPVYEASAEVALVDDLIFLNPSAPSPDVATVASFFQQQAGVREIARRLPAEWSVSPGSGTRDVRVTVGPSPGSLNVTSRDASPARAAARANAWAHAIVGYLTEVRGAVTDVRLRSHVDVLTQEVREYASLIAVLEARLRMAEAGILPGGLVPARSSVNPPSQVLPTSDLSAPAFSEVRDPSKIRKVLAALYAQLSAAKSALLAAQGRDAQILAQVGPLSGVGVAQVFAEAVPPGSPIAPKKKQNIIAGGLLGLICGAILAFVLESKSPRRVAFVRGAPEGSRAPLGDSTPS